MADHASTIDKIIEYLRNSFDPAAAGEIDALQSFEQRGVINFVIQDKNEDTARKELRDHFVFESSDLATKYLRARQKWSTPS